MGKKLDWFDRFVVVLCEDEMFSQRIKQRLREDMARMWGEDHVEVTTEGKRELLKERKK